MFRLAHLSDPHVGPVRRPRLRALFGKQGLGYASWQLGRCDDHDMSVLSALVADMGGRQIDHIACTGDLCTLGSSCEWAAARAFLESLGPPARVSFVPGNHDGYVPGALEGLLGACAPWSSDDSGRVGAFPYLRRRGPLALVGLSSVIPTDASTAIGRIGPAQVAAAEALLHALAREPEPPCRVVMIHHPPYPGGATPKRALVDAESFTAMIARVGAELVLHGHNHCSFVADIAGPDGRRVPVVGAASASTSSDALYRRASYHLFTIASEGGRHRIAGVERGRTEGGAIADLRPLMLDRDAVSTGRAPDPFPRGPFAGDV